MTPQNFFVGDRCQDFWVWINPSNWHVRHQISVVGGFSSAGSVGRGVTNLPFIPNPDFAGDVSPFSISLTNYYSADYNLEINRAHYFPHYPSRLNAIFLLRSEAEALDYKNRHIGHVGDRVLRQVRTVGTHACSTHDSSWIDFLRLSHSCDDQTIHRVAQAYWQGENVKDCQLTLMGKPWTQSPIIEVLYLGQVEFYDRTFPSSSVA